MHRIAFTTFAVLKQPYGNPEVEGFETLLPPILEEAERSPGFIAHPVEDPGQGYLSVFDRQWGAWGKFEVPRFYTGQRTNETHHLHPSRRDDSRRGEDCDCPRC